MGNISPQIIFSVVVLPAPFGPTRPNTSPAGLPWSSGQRQPAAPLAGRKVVLFRDIVQSNHVEGAIVSRTFERFNVF